MAKIIIILSCLILGLCGHIWAEVDPFIYDSKGKRDPFIPLIGKGREFLFTEEAVESIAGIYLEGIVWDPDGASLAIINDEIMAEDGLVGGFRVKKISKEGVILIRDDEEYIVNLIEEVEE